MTRRKSAYDLGPGQAVIQGYRYWDDEKQQYLDRTPMCPDCSAYTDVTTTAQVHYCINCDHFC